MLDWRRVDEVGRGGRVAVSFVPPWVGGVGVACGSPGCVGFASGVCVDVDVDGFEVAELSDAIRLPHTEPRPYSSPRAANFSNPFSSPKMRPSIRPARAPSATPWSWAVVYRVSSRVRRSSKGSSLACGDMVSEMKTNSWAFLDSFLCFVIAVTRF